MNVSEPHPPPAPWRSLFESHLRADSSSGTEFALATIRNDGGRPVPRVRTCGFRGFWPDPELHSKAAEQLKQDAKNAKSTTTGGGGASLTGRGLNPRMYESDMLTFTTDIRMEKIHEINEAGHVVEMLFWLKDAGNQWRIRGEAFAIGAVPDATAGQVAGAEGFARDEIRKGMRRIEKRHEEGEENGKEEEAREEGWTWERAVTTYFANHTPVMRGSFKNPPPGRPRSEQPSDPALKPGQKLTDLHDGVARKNFRVVVIRPTEVERLDLTDYERPQRWSWTLVDGGSRWKEVELWP